MPRTTYPNPPGRCLNCGQRWKHGPRHKRYCCRTCCNTHRMAGMSGRLHPKDANPYPEVLEGRRVRVACMAALARLGLPLDLPLPADLLD